MIVAPALARESADAWRRRPGAAGRWELRRAHAEGPLVATAARLSALVAWVRAARLRSVLVARDTATGETWHYGGARWSRAHGRVGVPQAPWWLA